MFSLENISRAVHEWLFDTLHPQLALMVEFAIIGVLIIGLFAVLGLVLVMMERKVSSWMQLRLGPNRIGPGGAEALVLLADIAVRVVLPERDLKLGVLMALIGAPLFLHLIYKTRRAGL